MPVRWLARRSLATVLLAAGLLLLPLSAASAHTALSSTTPADGAQLAEPPAQVELVFTDAVLELGAQIVVTGPGGAVEVGPPAVSGERVAAELPAGLAAGEYAVQWRVTADDGHPITGEFGFTVAAAPSPSVSPPVTGAPSTAEPVPTVDETSAPAPETTSAPEEAEGGVPTAALLGIGAGVVVAVGAGVALSRRGR